ncbi:MAG TPA: SRPBCC domain-containing protein, partial [Bacillales bacterium]|nr:SRPBCC domain-containing protein [Bacillales bacterium]
FSKFTKERAMVMTEISKDYELVITRTFEAPRELVWKAVTKPEHLKHWWGPKGYGMTIVKLDLRPDGVFHYSQTSPDGEEMWGKFVYREVDKPGKLVFTNSFSDEEGRTVRAPFSKTWPLEILNDWTLTEADGKTEITMRGTPLTDVEEEIATFKEAQSMVKQGFAGTFDQLADYLTKL